MRGDSCIESVSLPGLQSFFANLGMPGREYGYFQISHFDFPLNDSLVKTFSSTQMIIDVSVDYYFGPGDSDQDYMDDPGHMHTDNFSMLFDLRRVASSADIANRLKQVLSIFVPDPGDTDTANYRWQQFMNDVYFDPLS